MICFNTLEICIRMHLVHNDLSIPLSAAGRFWAVQAFSIHMVTNHTVFFIATICIRSQAFNGI